VREQSLREKAELESNLRKRKSGVLEHLGSALLVDYENGLQEDHLPAVYEKSHIFFYQLLFILYSESRGLLPVLEYGAGANRRYTRYTDLGRNCMSAED